MKSSEGIQIEYIAIFIAILFPGALVAFNYELLQTLPHLTALRVYSAGIWHNAVCAIRLIKYPKLKPPTLRVIPIGGTCLEYEEKEKDVEGKEKGRVRRMLWGKTFLVSFELVFESVPNSNLDFNYLGTDQRTGSQLNQLARLACSGHSPMVLDVPPASPLSGYLAPGDVILSVDNVTIRNAQEWLKLNTLTYNVKLSNVNLSQRSGDMEIVNKMKGYCIPSFMMEESKITELLGTQHVCPGERTAFVKLDSANVTLHDGQKETNLLNKGWSMYCLNAKDVVKRNRCGDDRGLATLEGGGSTCPQDEFCLAPVQEPGLVWVEIAYSSPSPECLSHEQNRFPFSETSGIKETNCGGTFIFAGEVISMAHSIQLTSYQPRWGPQIVAYFPNILERILIWTFHTSLALALLNGLPVYFLDGESILDATLSHFTSLSARKRKKVLRLCLLGGSLLSIIVSFRELL
ncbi:unnamed protein product [Sphenostylis stenocarpa]|uniref:Endopeptidase S2P n=1 Tax=Sphenostylis stenocarpa TaxID=92480 RepID=A0AA86VXP4_9FABA|nr:unnamed protein product [Sphenostylis stenocarpa]